MRLIPFNTAFVLPGVEGTLSKNTWFSNISTKSVNVPPTSADRKIILEPAIFLMV
jgi:hypothetical protein